MDEAETVFSGHTDPVYGIAVSHTHPELVATAGGASTTHCHVIDETLPGDDTAKLWDANTGSCIATLAGHTDSVASVGFNHDGSLLATGGLDGVVKVWKVESWELVQSLEGPGEDVSWIDWHTKVT